MGKIIIKDVLTYAFHGCLPSEKKIGGAYKTTIWIDGDFSKAEKSDTLADTIDYEAIINLITQEMQNSSDLIENVTHRIAKKMMLDFYRIDKLAIKVVKINPPVSAEVPQVEYFLETKR